ncbi:MAG: peptidoglycan editing factor PgeF [Firmicutes bacterium]|nr:peptidoglycan editing factor PgeF [Bacillota bacterium]
MSACPATPTARPREKDGVVYYTFPLLEAFSDRLVHAFSTRLGGVSEGELAALNLGLSRGDAPERLRENLRRFGAAVGFDWEKLVISQQTHTVNLRQATSADAGCGAVRQRPWHDVDGLWTAEPGLPLMTHYADCTPLLFYAADRHICAASHAGWRGTAAGMARVTVEQLRQQGCDPRQVYCVIGPSAGPCCYEVDELTASRFAALADEQGPVARPRGDAPGKFLLDLWRANRCQLLTAGLPPENVAVAGLCTICHPDVFYSHRVQGERRGSLAAVLMLK